MASERVGKQVRQRTLLNLGRQFGLPQPDWPMLCTRVEQILTGQSNFLPVSAVIERHAQRLASHLLAAFPNRCGGDGNTEDFAEVDVESLQLTHPRSVGVEQVALAAMGWLGLPEILSQVGFNGIQQAVVQALLVGGLAKLSAALQKPRGEKHRDAIMVCIGRLQEQSHGVGQHYLVTMTPDLEDPQRVQAISWEQKPKGGSWQGLLQKDGDPDMAAAVTDRVPAATAPRRAPEFVDLGALEDLAPPARRDDAALPRTELRLELGGGLVLHLVRG